MRRWFFIGFVAFWLLSASVVYATDFVLVVGPVNASKSVIQAEKLFVRLLEKGDRLGVVRFANEAVVVSDLSDVITSRFSILRAISKPPEGSYSNIYDGLLKARELLEKTPSDRRTIVLVTDRGMDLGADDKNEEYSLKLLDELIPECKRKGIRVYTVGLTEEADMVLLREIAHGTLGLSYSVQPPRKLHQVFSDIYENIKLADEIPIKDGEFLVDRETKEMKVVIDRENKSIIKLLQPDGRRVTYKIHPSHYRWYSTPEYELAVIPRPLPGKWKILNVQDRGVRIFINSSLRMKITDIPRVVYRAGKQKLYMWLQKDERILKNTSLVLRAVEFDIWVTPPEGKTVKVSINDSGTEDDDLAKDGVYTGAYTPDKRGEYTVRFLAQGKGFYRQKLIRFYNQTKQKKPKVAKKKVDKSKKPHLKKTVKAPVENSEYSLKRAFVKFAIFNAVLLSITGGAVTVVVFLKKKRAAATDEEEVEDED